MSTVTLVYVTVITFLSWTPYHPPQPISYHVATYLHQCRLR